MMQASMISLDISVHDLIQLVQCQVDTMIGYTSLWEVVGTDLSNGLLFRPGSYEALLPHHVPSAAPNHTVWYAQPGMPLLLFWICDFSVWL